MQIEKAIAILIISNSRDRMPTSTEVEAFDCLCEAARQAEKYREYLQRAKNAISTRSNDDNGCRYAFNLMQEALKDE